MTAPSHDCCVTFPVQHGVFGADRLAQRLNALVRDRRIGNWHLGRWTDWRHTAIEIAFTTPRCRFCQIELARGRNRFDSHQAAAAVVDLQIFQPGFNVPCTLTHSQ